MGAASLTAQEQQHENKQAQRLAEREARLGALVDSLAPVASQDVKKHTEGKWGEGVKAGLAKGFLNTKRRRKRTASTCSDTATATNASAATTSACAASAANASVASVATTQRTCESCCSVCSRRLPALTASIHCKCKCGLLFCSEHIQFHDCTFNHRAEHQRFVEGANPKVAASKWGTSVSGW